jgi:hypothetical protein
MINTKVCWLQDPSILYSLLLIVVNFSDIQITSIVYSHKFSHSISRISKYLKIFIFGIIQKSLCYSSIEVSIHQRRVFDIPIEIDIICGSDRVWRKESTHTWVVVSGSVVWELCFCVVLSACVESGVAYWWSIYSIYWFKGTTLSFSIWLTEERVGILIYDVLVFICDTDDTSEVVFLLDFYYSSTLSKLSTILFSLLNSSRSSK